MDHGADRGEINAAAAREGRFAETARRAQATSPEAGPMPPYGAMQSGQVFPVEQLEAPAEWAPQWMPLRERALFVTLLAAGVSALIAAVLVVFTVTLLGESIEATPIIAAMAIGLACSLVGWVGLGRNV